ncbi:hypothetical protein B0O99DRAFT_700911 [Bisporella sp. PMI_857]|nr:hypothetical protein B0O99DRAFT_700911 [Bisporella sp. PMI_857]
MEERLQAMLEKRSLPWRLGVEAGAKLSGRPNKCSIKHDDAGQSPENIETSGIRPGLQRLSPAIPLSPRLPPSKRKRMGGRIVQEWENIRPQWGHEHGRLPEHGGLHPPPQSAENIQHPQRPVQHVRSSWATVNTPTPARSQHIIPSTHSISAGRNFSAAVNQPPVPLQLSPGPVRQVYSLIAELQNGIEHLPKELDSLKKALGIDDKDQLKDEYVSITRDR